VSLVSAAHVTTSTKLCPTARIADFCRGLVWTTNFVHEVEITARLKDDNRRKLFVAGDTV